MNRRRDSHVKDVRAPSINRDKQNKERQLAKAAYPSFWKTLKLLVDYGTRMFAKFVAYSSYWIAYVAAHVCILVVGL